MSLYAQHLVELERRWAEALTAARLDAAVVAAGAPRSYFLDDQAPPYRANPHFAQWLPGLDAPHSVLLIVPGDRPRLYFYQPEDYWHLPPSTPDLGPGIEVAIFDSLEALTNALAHAVERRNRIAFVGESPSATTNLANADVNPVLLMNALHYGRAIKTPYELACMREATRIGVQGHVAAAAAFRSGASELEIHQTYLRASAQTEGELPYHNIVALNEHAAVLHYQHYDRSRPKVRTSFLIDAGARSSSYASDITRTYAADATGHFAQLIDALDREQQALIATLRVGQSFVEVHENMHRRVAKVLVECGIVRATEEAAFDGGITDAFFPHGLGHLLGLQVHDVAGHMVSPEGGTRAPPQRYATLRLTRRVEAGQVFTIEPGIYFIPMLLKQLRASHASGHVDWSRVEALVPAGGIRIEDNVHVTATGSENLTRDAFRAEAA